MPAPRFRIQNEYVDTGVFEYVLLKLIQKPATPQMTTQPYHNVFIPDNNK